MAGPHAAAPVRARVDRPQFDRAAGALIGAVSVGRNSTCPCGSGKRYKDCCGRLVPLSAPAPALAPSTSPAPGIPQLIALMNRGAHAELERRAGALLDADSDNGLLWQLLAIAQQHGGKEALPALQQAARCLPNDAVAQLNFANALARAGRLSEAAACYDSALTLRPDLAELHLEQERFDQAAVHARRAIGLNAELAEAHNTLGSALLKLARLDDAV